MYLFIPFSLYSSVFLSGVFGSGIDDTINSLCGGATCSNTFVSGGLHIGSDNEMRLGINWAIVNGRFVRLKITFDVGMTIFIIAQRQNNPLPPTSEHVGAYCDQNPEGIR